MSLLGKQLGQGAKQACAGGGKRVTHGHAAAFDVELAAINRAHRIGAVGPVTVTRLLMLETIEERINRVLEEKRELFDTIFSGTEKPSKLGLTQQEIFGLFDLKCPAGPVKFAA